MLRATERKLELVLVFLNFSKAFGDHDKMLKILKLYRISEENIAAIEVIYTNTSSSTIPASDRETPPSSIQAGIFRGNEPMLASKKELSNCDSTTTQTKLP